MLEIPHKISSGPHRIVGPLYKSCTVHIAATATNVHMHYYFTDENDVIEIAQRYRWRKHRSNYIRSQLTKIHKLVQELLLFRLWQIIRPWLINIDNFA